jgi:hypothetical protein
MIQQEINSTHFFDAGCPVEEQIPRSFSVSFKEVGVGKKGEVRVVLNNNKQVGDIINDNAHNDDFYRYHDIFHYTFATMLGWSPCTRAMMKCKRKSDEIIDEIEDGARATITEEALSMVIFNEAKRKSFFRNNNKVSKTTLRIIKEMTEPFEVKIRSSKDWEKAILNAYEVFRFLIDNKGGKVEFNANKKKIKYFSLN